MNAGQWERMEKGYAHQRSLEEKDPLAYWMGQACVWDYMGGLRRIINVSPERIKEEQDFNDRVDNAFKKNGLSRRLILGKGAYLGIEPKGAKQ